MGCYNRTANLTTRQPAVGFRIEFGARSAPTSPSLINGANEMVNAALLGRAQITAQDTLMEHVGTDIRGGADMHRFGGDDRAAPVDEEPAFAGNATGLQHAVPEPFGPQDFRHGLGSGGGHHQESPVTRSRRRSEISPVRQDPGAAIVRRSRMPHVVPQPPQRT